MSTRTSINTTAELRELASFGNPPDWMDNLDVSGGASGGPRLAKIGWHRVVNTMRDLHGREEALAGDHKLTQAGRDDQFSRAVRDAWTPIEAVRGHRDKLDRELRDWGAKYKDPIEISDTAMAAIWSKLPEDSTAMLVAHQAAMTSQDWRTVMAIEALPGVFSGHLDRETIAELKRQRMQASDPDHFAEMERREESLRVVESALNSAESRLGELQRRLPAPDPETGAELGSDGLRVLSPSQLEEARAGDNNAPAPGDNIRDIADVSERDLEIMRSA